MLWVRRSTRFCMNQLRPRSEFVASAAMLRTLKSRMSHPCSVVAVGFDPRARRIAVRDWPARTAFPDRGRAHRSGGKRRTVPSAVLATALWILADTAMNFEAACSSRPCPSACTFSAAERQRHISDKVWGSLPGCELQGWCAEFDAKSIRRGARHAVRCSMATLRLQGGQRTDQAAGNESDPDARRAEPGAADRSRLIADWVRPLPTTHAAPTRTRPDRPVQTCWTCAP